ncbi:MAG: mechanosensitive ion channel [Bacteroidetes bacterium]|nr:mechanosensitive ion channel [Bacteroidota bacterium]
MITNAELLPFIFRLIETAAAGFVLFILLKIIHMMLSYFTRGKEIKKTVLNVHLAVAVAAWAIFFLWGINLIFTVDFTTNPLELVLIVVLFVIFVWLAGRDILAGIILKFENSLELGNLITSDNTSGKIKKLGLRTVQLETETGELFTVPYTKISSEKVSIRRKENRYKYFEGEITVEGRIPPAEISEILLKKLMLSHYASVKTKPSVNFLGINEGKYKFKVTVPTLKKEYFDKLLFSLQHEMTK